MWDRRYPRYDIIYLTLLFTGVLGEGYPTINIRVKPKKSSWVPPHIQKDFFIFTSILVNTDPGGEGREIEPPLRRMFCYKIASVNATLNYFKTHFLQIHFFNEDAQFVLCRALGPYPRNSGKLVIRTTFNSNFQYS